MLCFGNALNYYAATLVRNLKIIKKSLLYQFKYLEVLSIIYNLTLTCTFNILQNKYICIYLKQTFFDELITKSILHSSILPHSMVSTALYKSTKHAYTNWKTRSPVYHYWIAMYGQLKEPPLSNISRIRVSIGVFPTSLTKNNCSITEALTVRRDGNRRRSLPKRVGWFGYWLRQYSSRAHWDFSWMLSIWFVSVRPHASGNRTWDIFSLQMRSMFGWWCI